MPMPDHFSAAVRTGHRLAYQSYIIVDCITVSDNVRLFYIGVAYIKHYCGKIDIRNSEFIPSCEIFLLSKIIIT